jgi:hypothetical protein
MVKMTTCKFALPRILESAGRELAAFLQATAGSMETGQPQFADQWISVLETTDWSGMDLETFFRQVSILAIARVASTRESSFGFCEGLESNVSEPCPRVVLPALRL